MCCIEAALVTQLLRCHRGQVAGRQGQAASQGAPLQVCHSSRSGMKFDATDRALGAKDH